MNFVLRNKQNISKMNKVNQIILISIIISTDILVVGYHHVKDEYTTSTTSLILFAIVYLFLCVNGTHLVLMLYTNKPIKDSDSPSQSETLAEDLSHIIADINEESCPNTDDKKFDQRLEEVKQYTKEELKPYLSNEDINKLLTLLDDYSFYQQPRAALNCRLPSCNGLTHTDIFHYVWNVWNHIDTVNCHFSCRFFISAMSGILEGISERTMYAKMIRDYGEYSIPLYSDIVQRTGKD